MWVRKSAVIFAVASLALASLSGTAVADDWEGQEWEGRLVAQLPDTDEYRDCHQWSECHDLRGIAIKDFDVSNVTEGYDEASYTLYDPSLTGLVTLWHLCMYEERGDQMELLDCDWNLYAYSEKGGDLDPDSDAVRIMVERGATSDYWFQVTAW